MKRILAETKMKREEIKRKSWRKEVICEEDVNFE